MASSSLLEPLNCTSKNIEKNKKNVIYIIQGRCGIILNPSSCTAQEMMKQISVSSIASFGKSYSKEMNTYQNRLKTFNSDWRIDFLTPSKMANAGFHYMGKEDHVKCMLCSQEYGNWRHGDDPLVEHKRNSPQCPFFTENSGFDVCGLYECPITDLNDEYTEHIENYLCSIGTLLPVKAPVFHIYATLESRLKSFEKCQIQLKQDIHSYVEAGLFYAGTGLDDVTMCFYCGQCLKNWEDNDQPLLKHARCWPMCSCLLLIKGVSFIIDIYTDRKCMDENSTVKYKEMVLSDLTGNITDENFLRIKAAIESISCDVLGGQKKQKNSEIITSSVVDLDSSQQNLNTIPDSVLCKICFKYEINVVVIPCCHAAQCAYCVMALKDCAICRNSFRMTMKVHIYRDESSAVNPNHFPCSSSQSGISKPKFNLDPCEVRRSESNEENPNQLSRSSSQSALPVCTLNQNLCKVDENESNEENLISLPLKSSQPGVSKPTSNQNLCKVCDKAEMGAVFIPCGHIYACFNCSSEMHNCPVCTDTFFGMMQVYL